MKRKLKATKPVDDRPIRLRRKEEPKKEVRKRNRPEVYGKDRREKAERINEEEYGDVDFGNWHMPRANDFEPNEAVCVEVVTNDAGEKKAIYLSRDGDSNDLFWSVGHPRKRNVHKNTKMDRFTELFMGEFPDQYSVNRLVGLLRLWPTDEELIAGMYPELTSERLRTLKLSVQFCKFLAYGRSRANISLRRAQLKCALGRQGKVIEKTYDDGEGNTVTIIEKTAGIAPHAGMLKFLGQQVLNQREQVTVENVFDIDALRDRRKASEARDRVVEEEPSLTGRKR